jgi:DNA primase catalytic core
MPRPYRVDGRIGVIMSESQVQEIKDKVDVLEIIGERVNLKKAGRSYKGLCPFHGEKTPSFFVTPEMQLFKCFGCGEAGDVYSFLQKYEGMSFVETLEYLAKRAGGDFRANREDGRRSPAGTADGAVTSGGGILSVCFGRASGRRKGTIVFAGTRYPETDD